MKKNKLKFGELCLKFTWTPIYIKDAGEVPLNLIRKVWDDLGVDPEHVIFEQFAQGCRIEMEHGTMLGSTNITNDELHISALIALAHLKEGKHYYTWLKQMEEYMDANDEKPARVFLSEKIPNDW